MSSELANQAAAQAIALQVEQASSSSTYPSDTLPLHADLAEHSNEVEPDSSDITQPPYDSTYKRPIAPLPQRTAYQDALLASEQLVVLREAYARNANPSKRELESLAEKTGRPWNKIREYFRQRRNKMRGLDQLENMEEPGRATGW